MFETITLSSSPGLAYLTADCRMCDWCMTFSTWRMDVIVKTVKEHAPHAVAPPHYLCYSGLMTETGNIIAAQIGALDALANAFNRQITTGDINTVAHARSFIEAWTEGVRSLAPATAPAPTKGKPTTDVTVEPEVGEQVRDTDGDVWTRESNGYWSTANNGDGTGSWEYVRQYAPLTLVPPVESLLEEPPVLALVRDKDGSLWTRVPAGGWIENYSPDANAGDRGLDWKYIQHWAPLTVVNLG